MDENILIGAIVGGVTASSIYVYQSDKFNKAQKAFLLVCFIFPPLQWVSILILLGLNNYKKQNSQEAIKEKQIIKETNSFDDKIKSLKELKEKEILTEEEYNVKIKNLEDLKFESELRLSKDYQKLKSLFDDGILSEDEFKTKSTTLKKKVFGNIQKLMGKWSNDEMYINFNSDFTFEFKSLITDRIFKGFWNFKNCETVILSYNGITNSLNVTQLTDRILVYDNGKTTFRLSKQ